jgi:hypothetical protein
MSYLVKEQMDPAGVRRCPYCLRPVLWRYTEHGVQRLMGDPLCRVHGSLSDWYVVKQGRITAVGHRRRHGRALRRPVRARTRPLWRQKVAHGRRGHNAPFIFTAASLARIPVYPSDDAIRAS